MDTCRWGDSTTGIVGPKTVPLAHLLDHELLVNKRMAEAETLLESKAWMFSKLTASEQVIVGNIFGTIEAAIKCCISSISEDLIGYDKLAGTYRQTATEINRVDRMICGSRSLRDIACTTDINNNKSAALKQSCTLTAYCMLLAGSEMQQVGKLYPNIATTIDAIKCICEDFRYVTNRILNLPNAKDIGPTLDFVNARLQGKVGVTGWLGALDNSWYSVTVPKVVSKSPIDVTTYLPWQDVLEFKHFEYGDKVNASIRAECVRKSANVFSLDASILTRCGPEVLAEYLECLHQFFKVFLTLATAAFCLTEVSSQCLSVSLKQKQLFDETFADMVNIEV